MAKKITLPQLYGDVLLLRLAREIAMEQHELDMILERNGVTPKQFQAIMKLDRFQKLLSDEITNWNSATNTTERVKIKAAAMIEEWLPEAFGQLHNEQAPLLHRTDLAKLVARLGGMEKSNLDMSAGGERFSVTINLGADQQLNFQKELPQKVIEGEVNDAN